MREGDVVDGRFVVGALAGRGRMGVIHSADDRVTGRRVALKTLVTHQGVDHARFAREAAVLSALAHENVVAHVAHGRMRDGTPYLGMEWVDGEDLASRLARGATSARETIALAARLASALAAAHANGVVHRDVKPSNVLLVAGDLTKPKLADFGIARMLGPATQLTRSGVLIGTPLYMAPEQVRGRSDVEESADIFALGAVLHECLSGRPAFEGDDFRAVFAKIAIGATPSLRGREGVPDGLADLLVEMLDKDPTRRPSSTSLVARLEALFAALPA